MEQRRKEERQLQLVRWTVRVRIPTLSIPLKICRKPLGLLTLSTKMVDSICTSSWKPFTRWRHGPTFALYACARHRSASWNFCWISAWSLHPSHRQIIPAAIKMATTSSKPVGCWVWTKKNFHVIRTVFVSTSLPGCSSTSAARTVAVIRDVIRLPILFVLKASS